MRVTGPTGSGRGEAPPHKLKNTLLAKSDGNSAKPFGLINVDRVWFSGDHDVFDLLGGWLTSNGVSRRKRQELGDEEGWAAAYRAPFTRARSYESGMFPVDDSVGQMTGCMSCQRLIGGSDGTVSQRCFIIRVVGLACATFSEQEPGDKAAGPSALEPSRSISHPDHCVRRVEK